MGRNVTCTKTLQNGDSSVVISAAYALLSLNLKHAYEQSSSRAPEEALDPWCHVLLRECYLFDTSFQK